MIGARARIRAASGDDGARVDIAHMLEPLATSAFINVKTDALVDAAEVEALLGDRDAAIRYFSEALALAEQKENLVLTDQLRNRRREMESAEAPTRRRIAGGRSR